MHSSSVHPAAVPGEGGAQHGQVRPKHGPVSRPEIDIQISNRREKSILNPMSLQTLQKMLVGQGCQRAPKALFIKIIQVEDRNGEKQKDILCPLEDKRDIRDGISAL